jgi:hypothetical protein
MSEVSIQTLSPQRVVSTVLRQLNHEQIEDAVACFTTDFRYKDHGIGLEFKDKERLTEFPVCLVLRIPEKHHSAGPGSRWPAMVGLWQSCSQ